MQQGFHRLGQRGRGTGTAVAEGIGQIARIVPFQPTEHRIDVRGVGFDVRHHHDHVPGLKARVVAETVQQFILENFHFPLGAVADAEMDRAVDLQRGSLFRGRQGFQIENVLLQVLQQCFRFAVFKQIDLVLEGAAITVRVVVIVKQADKVPALFAPGGQQRVDPVFRQGGQVAFAVVQLATEQLFVFDNIGPVMLAGVLYQHQDLAMLAECGQGFQGLLGQGADAEDDQPTWQARRWRALFLVLSQCGHEIPVDGTAAEPLLAVVHVRQQGAPQMRLP